MADNAEQMRKFAKYLKIDVADAWSNTKVYKEIKDKIKGHADYKNDSVQEALGKWEKSNAGSKPDSSKTTSGSTSGGKSEDTSSKAVTLSAGAPATANAASRAEVTAPSIVMHVPSPTVVIETSKFPGWWAVTERVQRGLLSLIAGAAMYHVLLVLTNGKPLLLASLR